MRGSLREKEEEDERKRKEWEDQVKKSAEAERERQNKEAKENVEKARLELPATGKIGKMTWVKQQQRIQEKIKQRQEEAKEREAVQQKGRLQFSFGRAAPTFQTANNNQMGQQGPRIDAATFMKKLKEEKERNQIKDQAAEPATLDQFLSVGNDSLPVVTETIPLPKALQVESAPKFVSTEVSPSLPKSDVQKEREEDLKMLGIDPDSTSVMDISNRPPVMAARKPNTVATSPGASGAATSASSLYSVFNPSTSHTEPAPPVVSSVTSTSTSSSDGWISSFAQSKPTGQETIALSDIPVPAPDRDTHQVDGNFLMNFTLLFQVQNQNFSYLGGGVIPILNFGAPSGSKGNLLAKIKRSHLQMGGGGHAGKIIVDLQLCSIFSKNFLSEKQEIKTIM